MSKPKPLRVYPPTEADRAKLVAAARTRGLSVSAYLVMQGLYGCRNDERIEQEQR